MKEEIRQGGKVILSSEDRFTVPMIFNNLCGKNFSEELYHSYLKYVAFESMGVKPGTISYYRNGCCTRRERFLMFKRKGFMMRTLKVGHKTFRVHFYKWKFPDTTSPQIKAAGNSDAIPYRTFPPVIRGICRHGPSGAIWRRRTGKFDASFVISDNGPVTFLRNAIACNGFFLTDYSLLK